MGSRAADVTTSTTAASAKPRTMATGRPRAIMTVPADHNIGKVQTTQDE
jgi:hypothetical protein